ncbi:hypothetical protein [Geotalea toluenoxydans]|uniref:hypothetical protein n=1 Tax=Geotalea toluenoxydans TaxID=421624 RepID=UPI0006D282A2|nr:hypothetical protein [Geotalea toluenoxydans]
MAGIKKEVAEILTGVPERLQNKWQLRDDTYFSDNSEFGAQKAMKNLEESSWWSKHLSKTMFTIYFVMIIAVSLLSLMALFVSLNSKIDAAYIPKVSKIVMSSIMVLFSIGSLKLMMGYLKFHRKAETIETAAKLKQKHTDLSEIEALRLWNEYHISRAFVPLIPDKIWKLRQKRLNELWDAGAE